MTAPCAGTHARVAPSRYDRGHAFENLEPHLAESLGDQPGVIGRVWQGAGIHVSAVAVTSASRPWVVLAVVEVIAGAFVVEAICVFPLSWSVAVSTARRTLAVLCAQVPLSYLAGTASAPLKSAIARVRSLWPRTPAPRRVKAAV
jgi:hypothetical protein